MSEKVEEVVVPVSFTGTIKNIAQFSDMLKLFATVADDDFVTLFIRQEGFFVQQMDPTNACYCGFSLSNPAGFESFNYSGDMDLPINVGLILKWIKGSAEDSLEIKASEQSLVLSKSGRKSELTTNIGSEKRNPQKPNLPELPVTFRMKTETLDNILRDQSALKLSTEIFMKSMEEGLAISSSAAERGIAKSLISWDELGSYKADALAKFDLGLLTNAVDAVTHLFEEVDVAFGNSLPLTIVGSAPSYQLHYLIGPKVD